MILGALGRSEEDPAVRALADAFGGDPAEARERLVGAPARRSRRLLFASGGEIILHDDAVVAVLLHLAPRGLDLAEWLPGTGNDATLDDLAQAIGGSPHFAGLGTPYFTLDGGYARAVFRDNRGWKAAGNLVGITVTADKPGLACRPEDDDCPACADLLVRGQDGGVDVAATTAALAAARTAGVLTEDTHWVRLADLRPLHASGLMARVESQLTCTTCRRIICVTLYRDAAPTFGYHAMNDARQRPLEAIPPVEQWGDAARIAAERDAMHYVDHEPGAWFLVEQQGTLYLDARYSYSAVIDDSVLIRLDESEVAAYRAGGHDYLSDLARRIHDSGPYREESPYHRRDLFRGPDGKEFRAAVSAAIVNHTWLAQQRDVRR
ncbi:hypothetical protein JCM33774_04720 [Actinophytocola sp. KF-1]